MKTLFIEGSSDTDNGNLREAFSKLLAKELKGKMPKIVMGGGKNQTVDKFHSTLRKKNDDFVLLFDSDEPSPDKKAICDDFNSKKPNRKNDCTIENTFLMVQEVEAWILSQPEVLTTVGIDMTKFNCANVETIHKPCEKLAELYKKTEKRIQKSTSSQRFSRNSTPQN